MTAVRGQPDSFYTLCHIPIGRRPGLEPLASQALLESLEAVVSAKALAAVVAVRLYWSFDALAVASAPCCQAERCQRSSMDMGGK